MNKPNLFGATGASISSLFDDINSPASGTLKEGEEVAALLSVDLLQRGKYQPRTVFDSDTLKELADSIAEKGVIQPIIVRSIEDERFEIIAGERRWRACQMAGKENIPAIIREIDDSTALALALVENIQREDLKPMEEAEALQRLKDEFKLKNKEVANQLGKSENKISLLLSLLKLPACLKELYDRGVTSPDVLNELARSYKIDSEATEVFIANRDSITIKEARAFKDRDKGLSLEQETENPAKTREVETDNSSDSEPVGNEKIPTSGFSEKSETSNTGESDESQPENRGDLETKDDEKIPTSGFSEKSETGNTGESDESQPENSGGLETKDDEKIPTSGFSEKSKTGNTGKSEAVSTGKGFIIEGQKTIVTVEYQGDKVYLDLNRKDDDIDYCWIISGTDKDRVLVNDLKLIAIQ